MTAGSSSQTLAVQAASVSAVLDYSAVFDAQYYYNLYPDLQLCIGNNPQALLQHFVAYGMKEGRIAKADFQVKAYMQYNLDLVAAYGADDLTKYYIHYITYGKAENRIAVYPQGYQPPVNLLGTYTTLYVPTEERAVNVELAAQRVNGTILEPGQTFSFSQAVGKRTRANGYVLGPSFAGGKVVSSIGGGICQVSSTMYVSMLLAGIAPTEHHFHSLPVDYVPKGLDAAIAQGYKDLRFKNIFPYPILIQAQAENGILTVSFVR